MRTINATFPALAMWALAACYNTNGLVNGGLVCGANASCPDGYTCKQEVNGSVGHCWKNGTGPDAGSVADVAAKPDVAACTAATPPYGPFATCSANQPIPNSTCDPICQSGCPCNRRCVLDEQTNTSFVCESAAPTTTSFVPPLGSCEADPRSCAPGSVCVDDSVCKHLCYKTCRGDQDCGTGSRCTASTIVDNNNQPVKNLFFCSPPTEACNPVGTAGCVTARSGFKCVFLAGMTGVAKDDATVCDCSSLHTVAVGQKCESSPDDCQAGAVCVSGTCHTICSLKGSTGGCSGSGGCTPIYGSTTYGYCR